MMKCLQLILIIKKYRNINFIKKNKNLKYIYIKMNELSKKLCVNISEIKDEPTGCFPPLYSCIEKKISTKLERSKKDKKGKKGIDIKR